MEALKGRRLSGFSGTLGPLVQVPNRKQHSWHQCLPNDVFPPNLHEYDIVIIDLQNPKVVPYVPEDHTHAVKKGYEHPAFSSQFPETLFDPRAFSAKALGTELPRVMGKESVLVVFATEFETTQYHRIAITSRGLEGRGQATYRLYDFYSGLPPHQNLEGKDTSVVVKNDGELAALLKRHNAEVTYRIIFEHPGRWKEGDYVKSQNFIPLIESGPGQVVAFAWKRKSEGSTA